MTDQVEALNTETELNGDGVVIQVKEDNPDKDGCKVHRGSKPGYAAIKTEFLAPDHKPVINLQYVSKEVKEKLQSEEKVNCEDPDNTTVPRKHAGDGEENEGEPPQKMAKLKGRNKKRPRTERFNDKDKICPAIKGSRECRFGDNCKFSHDKQAFMDKKPPDLEGPCPIFSKFGYCENSIACRFANSHLSDKMENLKNEELFEKMKSEKTKNILDHDLRQKLWKRSYDFQRSKRAVKYVEKNFRGWGLEEKRETETSAASLGYESKRTDAVTLSEGNCLERETVIGDSKLKDTTLGDLPIDDGNKEHATTRTLGHITDEEVIPLRQVEKITIDFRDKLYLAPLTTVGNLPFRRVVKGFGADVTCGEMALATELLKAKASEWSLVKRHPCEDLFGVQVCGNHPDLMTRCAQLLTETMDIDFIDINCGCPIEMIYKKGSGSALMAKATKLEQICRSMKGVMRTTPLTVKVRTGVFDNKNVAHTLIPRLRDAGVSLVTVHGRSREQRYTKTANWDYIDQCASAGAPMPVFGNGDILSFEDANLHRQQTGVSGLMIARGALIKPWIFTEIKEQRHIDISSGERMDMLRDFTNYGLEHWGSDNQGVEITRRFLLEWLSFLHRYIPVGVLEVLPQKINEKPPYYIGRNDLETLMSSANCADWIKLTEMLLGPVPDNFKFLPKHKANAYQ